MKNCKIRFSGGLSLKELVKISMSDNYNVITTDAKGIVTCSHQGSKYLTDGTYIAVHAFRMRLQTGSEVDRFQTGLIDVRVDEDPTGKRGHTSIYVTIHY